MGTIPKPRPDAGRGKILSTALLALALLASLVTFSPFADASGGGTRGNGGSTTCHENFTEYEWSLWVEDSPAVPAEDIYEYEWKREFTEYKYKWKKGNETKWSETSPGHGWSQVTEYKWKKGNETKWSETSPGPGWSQVKEYKRPVTRPASETKWSETSPGKNWSKTGQSRKAGEKPAQPAIGHHEYQWAENSPGDSWTKTDTSRSAEREVPCPPECAETPNLVHTFDPVSGSGTVYNNDDLPLCDPVYIHATTYTLDNQKAGESIWPQTLFGVNTKEITGKTPVSFQAPGVPDQLVCAQIDIYYTGKSASHEIQQKLYGPNDPFEHPFLHSNSSGPNPTWAMFGGGSGATGTIFEDCVEEEPGSWKARPVKNWTFINRNNITLGEGDPRPDGRVQIVIEWSNGEDSDSVRFTFDTNGNLVSTSPSFVEIPDGAEWSVWEDQTSLSVPGWECTLDPEPVSTLDGALIAPMASEDVEQVGWFNNTCRERPTIPTIPEQPTSTTSTTEEVGGIDEEPTTTTEAPTTTEPEVLDTVVTPTTVAKQTLPKTGSNTSTVLSLAGVLMTAGAAFVLFGRRRFNAGN